MSQIMLRTFLMLLLVPSSSKATFASQDNRSEQRMKKVINMSALNNFKYSNDFERMMCAFAKQIYIYDYQKKIEITPDLIAYDEHLSHREKYFLSHLISLNLENAIENFPKLISDFQGTMALLVLFTNLHLKNDLRVFVYALDSLLEKEKLTYGNIEAVETLLLFPLSFMKRIAREDWLMNQDIKYNHILRKVSENYIQEISDLSYRILFYKNINFYDGFNNFYSLLPRNSQAEST